METHDQKIRRLQVEAREFSLAMREAFPTARQAAEALHAFGASLRQLRAATILLRPGDRVHWIEPGTSDLDADRPAPLAARNPKLPDYHPVR